jgi:DNA-binding PadR family transcriptional regulator
MAKAMQEPTFVILTALLSGPLHGYAILSEVQQMSQGRVQMRVGTLYAALDRLAAHGLVQVDNEEVVNGRLRRGYRLTGLGATALTEETERLELLARQARRRLASRLAQSRLAQSRLAQAWLAQSRLAFLWLARSHLAVGRGGAVK